MGRPRVPAGSLSPRQSEIAALVAIGSSNRQIAEKLGIAESSVANHLSVIYAQLRIKSRSQLSAHITRLEQTLSTR